MGAAHLSSLGLGAAPALGGAGADKVALHVGEASQYGDHPQNSIQMLLLVSRLRAATSTSELIPKRVTTLL